MKFVCLCLLGITILVELLLPTLENPDGTLEKPNGFLSINCGASENEPGGDDLLWVSDSRYIKTKSRQNYSLDPGNLYLPYRTISYFTVLSQKKYCYLLPVTPGIPYLVRTQFSEGFQTQLPLASVFDLFIGGAKWIKVNLTNGDFGNDTVFNYEIILATQNDDQLSLCLARNSQTEHGRYLYISTIELRQLDPSMYTLANIDFNKAALVLIMRRNFGGEFINYRQNKADKYDREWYTYTQETDMCLLNTTDSLETGMPNHVPEKVLQTALSAKGSEDMDISDGFVNYASDGPGSYYFLFYFCNINRNASSGTTNTFTVKINDEETDWVGFVDYLQCRYLSHDIGTNDTNIEVVLRPSNYSAALGPFINGAELYRILERNDTHHEDVVAIWDIAEAINVPDDWSGADPCLPSDYSSTGITCSKENPPRVIIINLTSMGLVGSIPTSIAKLTALKQLLLGNNSLSGHLPDLSPLKNLTILQLQQNQLEGSIPTSLEKLPLLNQLYLQNNYLSGTVPQGLVKLGPGLRVDPQIKFPAPQIKFPAHKRKSWTMGISVGCSVLLVFVVICTTFIWKHRHRSQPFTTRCPRPRAQHASADIEDQNEYGRLAIEYTEDDIKAATNNYSTVIGRGSFGLVFYGRLSGSDVAVKVRSTDANQGQQEFHNEVGILSRIHHKHLVNLVGYCRQPVLALVYEYMQCGSLKDHLYGRINKLDKPLNWHTRLNIALQAAEGLLYLHHGCNPSIIHRDIKCSNILLDKNMCAKVADFGISKMVEVESSKSYVSTNVKGTMGYLDPQYFETSALTEKSDVYSFGIVLLEIISGISPKDGIIKYGRESISCGRLVELIDPSLDGRYNLAFAWRVADITYQCTEENSVDRPQMSEVVKELQEAMTLLEEDDNLFGNVSITTSIEGDLPSLR